MSSQEQPEDQSADDQPESAEPDTAGSDQAPEATEEPATSPEDERLEKLGERIDKARAHAEDAGVIDDPDEEEYADSGATPSEDDQTITPPG